MARKIISGIRPTRIELLKLRKREILAKKGHDLLEEKRDALVVEFLRMIREYEIKRQNLADEMRKAYDMLEEAQLVMGVSGIEKTARGVSEIADIEINERVIMGVKLPKISYHRPFRKTTDRGYSYIGTSVTLDEAADAFDRALHCALELAEEEGSLKRLAYEIETTKRRVNALENVVIPLIQRTMTFIEMHLDELEREDIFRRKRTKALIKKAVED